MRGRGLQRRAARATLTIGPSSVSRAALLGAVILLACVVFPVAAAAEPLCTDTWAGGASGSWQTGSNWSKGTVPTSSDVACVPEGDTVELTSGTGTAEVLLAKGSLSQSGGSTLELTGALEPSSIAKYTLTNGTLTGAATVNVATSLTVGTAGSMSGGGVTVVQSGATGTITGRLNKRKLVNEGSLTLGEQEWFLTEGAIVENKGTFTANLEAAIAIGGEGSPSIVNTGVFRRTSGTGATGVEVRFVNEATAEALVGELLFAGGGTGSAAGVWTAASGATVTFSKGTFTLKESSWHGKVRLFGAATVASEGLRAENANVVVNGTWSLASGSTHCEGFELTAGGIISGAGSLSVAKTFAWTEGTMKGSGSTTVQSSVSAGKIAGNLEGRNFINEGTLKIAEAELYMGPGAHFENTGTLIDDYEDRLALGLVTKTNRAVSSISVSSNVMALANTKTKK